MAMVRKTKRMRKEVVKWMKDCQCFVGKTHKSSKEANKRINWEISF